MLISFNRRLAWGVGLSVVVIGLVLSWFWLNEGLADTTSNVNTTVLCSGQKPVISVLNNGQLTGYDSDGNVFISASAHIEQVAGITVPNQGVKRVVVGSSGQGDETFLGKYSLGDLTTRQQLGIGATAEGYVDSTTNVMPLSGQTWANNSVISPAAVGSPDQISAMLVIDQSSCDSSASFAGSRLLITDYLLGGSASPVNGGNITAASGVTLKKKAENQEIEVVTFHNQQLSWLAIEPRPKGIYTAEYAGANGYGNGYASMNVEREGESSTTRKQRVLVPIATNQPLNATIYTPGQGVASVEGGMVGQQGIQFTCQDQTGNDNGCGSGSILGSVLNGDYNQGAIAVNHPSAAAAAWPLPENIEGNGTWYMSIPGYNGGTPAPVTDTFAVGQSQTNATAGDDGLIRVDLATAGNVSDQESSLVQAGGVADGPFGSTRVKATVYWGFYVPVSTFRTTVKPSGTLGTFMPLSLMDGTWSAYFGFLAADGYAPINELVVSDLDTIFSRGTLVPPDVIKSGGSYHLTINFVNLSPDCSQQEINDGSERCFITSQFGVHPIYESWHDAGNYSGIPMYSSTTVGTATVNYATRPTKVEFNLNFGALDEGQRQLASMWGVAIRKEIRTVGVGSPYYHEQNDLWTIRNVAFNTTSLSSGSGNPSVSSEPGLVTSTGNEPTTKTAETSNAVTDGSSSQSADEVANATAVSEVNTATDSNQSTANTSELTTTAEASQSVPVDLGASLVSLVTTSLNPDVVSQVVSDRTQQTNVSLKQDNQVIADSIDVRLLTGANRRLSDAQALQTAAWEVYQVAATRRERIAAYVAWKKQTIVVANRRRDQSIARALVTRYRSMLNLVAKSDVSVASWQTKYQQATTAAAKKSAGRSLVSAERTRTSRVKTASRYEAQINRSLKIYGF